jgi:hypothetical protein
MDEQTPKPVAWLRFGVDGPEGIFLSDRAAWSARHREHSWQNRGTIVGADNWTERYVVAAFPFASTDLRACEVCGEPNALIFGAGVGNILYSGGDLSEAERVFEDAFH